MRRSLRVERLAPCTEAVGGPLEVAARFIGATVSTCDVPVYLRDRGVPGRREGDDLERCVAGLLIAPGALEIPCLGGGDGGRDDERDTARRARLRRAADRARRLAHELQSAGRIAGRLHHRTVDPVECVVADLGLASHQQRIHEIGPRVPGPVAVVRDLRAPQQR